MTRQLPHLSSLHFMARKPGTSNPHRLMPDFGLYSYGMKAGWPLHLSLIFHPDIIGDLVQANSSVLRRDKTSLSLFQKAFGRGIISTEGEAWEEQKQKFQSFFTRASSKDNRFNLEEVIDKYLSLIGSHHKIDLPELQQYLICCALELNWYQLFGIHFTGDINKIYKFQKRLMSTVPLGIVNIPFYSNIMHYLVKYNHRSIIEELKQIMQYAGLQERGFTPEEVLNILMAGSLTTGSILHFAISHLNNEYSEKYADDEKFRMLFHKELLRMYPSVWMLWREVTEDIEAGGFSFLKGEIITINLFALHRHPEFWENPDTFYPYRFENNNRNRFSYMPFGFGVRKCMGANFATDTMHMFLQKLTSDWRFELKSRVPPDVTDRIALFPKLRQGTFRLSKARNIVSKQKIL